VSSEVPFQALAPFLIRLAAVISGWRLLRLLARRIGCARWYSSLAAARRLVAVASLCLILCLVRAPLAHVLLQSFGTAPLP